jgi:Secretion system C-terminal sorting domain
VRTTDSRGLAFEKTFKFIVVMPPSNILLDGNNTALLSYSGTLDADRLNVVLTAVDPNFGESNMTYSLVKGVGDQNNSLFDIKGGNKLFNKSSLQLADTLRIRIAVSNGYAAYEKTLKIVSNCQFATVKLLDVKSVVNKICEGQTVDMVLPATGTTVNLFRDNAMISTFTNTSKLQLTLPGKYYAIYSNGSTGCGSKTDSIFVEYNVPVTQITPEGSTTICDNTSVNLSATGATGYTYQWLKNNVAVSGASGTVFQAREAAEYKVKITNSSGCSAVSDPVSVSTKPSPVSVLNVLSDTTICAGSSIMFTVPSGAVNYNWMKDGQPQNNNFSNSLMVNQAASINVIVTGSNGCSSSSQLRRVNVSSNPTEPGVSIISTNTIACAGTPVVLSGQILSGMKYQWLKDGAMIQGANTSNYNATSAGNYQLQIANSFGCSNRSANIDIKGAIVAKPQVTLSGSPIVCEGAKLTLTSSVATGNQWFRDGALIPGAVGNNFVPTQDGRYTVSSSLNGCSSDTSSGIQVKYKSLPIVIVTASATSICAGSNATFIANTDATGASYLWYKDGVAMKNDTLVSFNAVDSGKYSVAVTSEGCSKSSSTIALKVNPIPSKPTISLNQAEMISSATAGNQWFSQGNPVQGATAQNFRPTSNGYYTVRSTVNGCVGFMSESFYYLATSVVNLNNDQFIKLFPNPVEDVLKVEYRINHVQPLDLRIFDVAGKLVFEERKLKSGMNLNLSALRSGLYLVRIQKRDGVVLFNDKMIKK